MNLQDKQAHFFDRLYSELGFPASSSAMQEIVNSIDFSLPTHLIFHNLSLGETLEGSFFLGKNLLVYYQAGIMGHPTILLDLSYARLHKCNQRSGPRKIQLEKNQNSYEVTFYNQNDYEDWMLKLKKICVLTNFEEKYQIAEITEISRDRCECLLEARMGGNHYSARKFDKKHITDPEFSLEMIRLMNKIEILRGLGDKRVLHLNEVYETEDSIYLVTDFAKNTTLKKVLKATTSPFEPAKTQAIMYQLLKILAHMASKNTAHRNIKPSSILMEEKGHIRITNFCLATFINGPHANDGICGTPGYIAPEVLNCHHEDRVYDDKVDVFSAGCIFFKMIFGHPLFDGSGTSEISSLNKNFKYSDLIQFVMKEQKEEKCLSTKLRLGLLLKMLHADPKQRISAQEALRDGYFKFQESSDSRDSLDNDNETLSKYSQTSPQQNCRKRTSFDLSPTFSTSVRGSFSEAASHQERSTLYPSKGSIRKLPAGNYAKFSAPSVFKNQPKFKSSEEMKLPSPLKRFSAYLAPLYFENSQKGEEEEGTDTDNPFDESPGLPLSKNCPLVSPRTQKHPSFRI